MKTQPEMRKWRKMERGIGAMVTESLLSQGFSEEAIAQWGPDAWHWVDTDTVDRLIEELAQHFGDNIATSFLIEAVYPKQYRNASSKDCAGS